MKDMLLTRMYLGKVYIKLDQPIKALECYAEAHNMYPYATTPLIGMARIFEELNDLMRSAKIYKKVCYICFSPSKMIVYIIHLLPGSSSRCV
jgi:tetratricopeptide (TPR) repeat protein